MAGVKRPVSVEGGPLLDGHLLIHSNQRLFILINHGPDEALARVYLPDAPEIAAVTDLFVEKSVGAVTDSEGLHFEVPLDGYGSTALLVE